MKQENYFVFDYFIRDHLGNTRMVLTDEVQQDAYPVAAMETGSAENEKAIYSNIDETRVPKPAGYPEDNYTDPNNFVSKLNGNGHKIGTGIVLKVMSGDKFNIRANAWHNQGGSDHGVPVSPLNDLLTLMAQGVSGAAKDLGKFTITQLQQDGVLNPGISSMLTKQGSDYTNNGSRPKAYLNWVLFDEQLKYVESSSGFDQVGAAGEFKTWVKTNLPVNSNGYIYIYTSNESPVDVFFDNLQVTHVRGPLLEETHYYPFGLTMAGVSSKAAGKLENKIKFNGKELNEDLELDWYEYGFRNNFDPQLGRFHSVDPLASDYPYYTPYQFAGNQPTIAIDLDGLEPAFINDIAQWAAKKVGTNPNSNTSKAIGVVAGVGKSIEKTVDAVTNPIATGKALLNMGTPEGAANMAVGLSNSINTLQNGTGFEKAVLISETVTDVATAIVGTKGVGTGVRAAEAASAASEAASIGKEIGILKDAAKGKGNFGLGQANANTSNTLGQAWVGEGATVASDGKTMVSSNGLRQYRPPSQKASSHANTGIQSNFEWRNKPQGQWQGNGHLNISQPSVLERFLNFVTGK